jgi:hypothetical protein
VKSKQRSLIILWLFAALFIQLSTAHAQGTAFTYQGQLANNGYPANGTYDLSFALFTTNSGGIAIAGPVTNSTVTVNNGSFTVMIDFGPGAFDGGSNWLEIAVSTNGANSFTTLAPRQQLTPVPYAMVAASIAGSVPMAQLPATLVTNGSKGINFSGAFTGNLNGSAAAAALASNIVSGISITNAFITNSIFAGNGRGLTNLPAQLVNWSQITNGPAASITANGDGTLSIATAEPGSTAASAGLILVDTNTCWPFAQFGIDTTEGGYAGQLWIQGAPTTGAYDNICGIHVANPRIEGDSRMFVVRVKDPSPSDDGTLGAYVLFEGRYSSLAPDNDTLYYNFLESDNTGNVAIGDLGWRSDGGYGPDSMLHPPAKTTLYGSPGGYYPAFEIIAAGYDSSNANLTVTASGDTCASGTVTATNGFASPLPGLNRAVYIQTNSTGPHGIILEIGGGIITNTATY